MQSDDTWGVLGDPTRRAIFELLARDALSVGELARRLPISQPAVSQHLRVLREAGLVVSQAEASRRVYRLNPEGVGALRAWLEGVWGDALTGFQKGAGRARGLKLVATDLDWSAGRGPEVARAKR